MEIRIMNPDPDGNGEICFRGRHVFMGYLFNEAKTRVRSFVCHELCALLPHALIH
jgi:acyl-CoA synthetase (AMP-forming)/AMP-acid ligase II